ncbi:uncharacterized protein PHACADRAFT_261333 [Phanerochaete carnosa HHB-10118-sp]|uniref:C2H2-type domain-containing protein n=1 Tax=Phanerochaete carnosa (strain HHB-10118-sp) TaxID=650164 RepID=K5VMP1_PHACS|nr:uncharacterized protein PHACADRAFT_261333 [Phanerochaete carnosa HHB-10118-sp]EKM52728.1 hypothetical protein PHACADRAFT_261333 [Phanerochaete carnosa HHB-10118-sp]
MSYATMSPSFSIISSSSYHALQHIISTPSQPQAEMSPLQDFAQLSLHSEYAVSPTAIEMSPYQAIASMIPETQFNAVPSAPETQLYSTSSTPSSLFSLSYGSACTTGSNSTGLGSAPSLLQKRTSGRTCKTAEASPAPQHTPKTCQYFAPSSPSLTSANSVVSRAPAIKYTTRRTRQVDADRAIAEPETDGPGAYMCPLCEHHQANRHLPDLRRHILAHYPDARVHVCRGVRLAAAPPGAVERFGVVEEDGGEERVGGCYQVFSRRDALLRHLQNPNKACLYNAAELRRRVRR